MSVIRAIREKLGVVDPATVLPFLPCNSGQTGYFSYLVSQPRPIPAGSSIISVFNAKHSPSLDAAHKSSVDFKLGYYFSLLHSRVQNDWFGLPRYPDPAEPSYSWQESFTEFIESAIEKIDSSGAIDSVALPFTEIRRLLSIAIGSFLFDDVEVPALVTFSGTENDILAIVAENNSASAVDVVFPPGSVFSCAVWGDPLMEALFTPPGPSDVFMQGYRGDSSPDAFPARTQVKLLWYTLYRALLGYHHSASCGKQSEAVPWAEKIRECVAELQTRLSVDNPWSLLLSLKPT
ncbi:hypothetical protein FISHEDRAFT_56142 [Fistulina hepatica ATCC 64428]|uniref:Aminoglycoside phosphotransferase domain-containing protein n=1 Tax=Fistulina hepatica ATCC 64428 TaxID=1128425 RepID=A0A0D7AJX8_9AGAR|nr:hypothetical protein FISHEDRAFT_56142 [Fistulina hepatica ATCC 64428]